ncbi:MAG: site-specific DNA-methyltransferase [Gammaproteobacteria bacterium]
MNSPHQVRKCNAAAVAGDGDRQPCRRPAQPDCVLKKSDFARFLQSLPPASVDLLLTDPPYHISRKTGFASVGPNGVARFAVSMDFGEWDHAEIDLAGLAKHAYRALRKGGTAIVFYDLWKVTNLADALRAAGFVQLRFIEWIKTNPVPLNSKRNYLSNSREIAVLAVKGGKPTFHSEYDNGQYHYPIPNNGARHHPTQKPLRLFGALITKHSRRGDFVIDPFVGGGTTALAALAQGRKFAGCDADGGYVQTAKMRVKEAVAQAHHAR